MQKYTELPVYYVSHVRSQMPCYTTDSAINPNVDMKLMIFVKVVVCDEFD